MHVVLFYYCMLKILSDIQVRQVSQGNNNISIELVGLHLDLSAIKTTHQLSTINCQLQTNCLVLLFVEQGNPALVKNIKQNLYF